MQTLPKRGTHGRIPLKIKIFTRDPTEQEMYVGMVQATPAMVVDAKSKSDMTARYWVCDHVGLAQTSDVTFDLRDNEPIPYLTLVGLVQRAQGGDAWQVLTPDKLLVDLKRDVILHHLFTRGIRPNGILEGPFRWVRFGSSMRLVAEDSLLYQDLEKLEAVRRLPHGGKLSAKTLTIGGVYRGSQQDRWLSIFLGPVRHKGKKLLAWGKVFLTSILDREKTLQEMYEEWYERGQRYCGCTLILTQSCSFTTKIGDVVLKPLPAHQFRNGFGETMHGPVEWIK